jgi:hypothetical protein
MHMERRKLTAAQASDPSSQVSITTNRSLGTVADDLVRTGELVAPVDPPAPGR